MRTARSAGLHRSENVGTSSDKTGEKPVRRKPEVSRGRLILPGSVGPKPRPKGAGDRATGEHSCTVDSPYGKRSDAEGQAGGGMEPRVLRRARRDRQIRLSA